MKKNLTRKLALSAVTMGVAALTVTSTTYAWYTSNATATASTITGTAKAADGNLLIGKNSGDTSSYSTTQTIDNVSSWATSLTFDTNNNAKLEPVTYDSTNSKWVKIGGGSINSTDAPETAIVRQTVWFNIDSLSGSSTDYYLSVTMSGLTQNPTNGKTQKLSVSDEADKELNKITVKSRTVNLTDVLACRITPVSLPSGVTATGANSLAYKYTTENATEGDAVVYYNNVYGLTGDKGLTRPTDYETSTYSDRLFNTNKVNLFTLKGFDDTASEQNYRFGVTFEFYIDGWDYQCYNAIGGQSFAGLSLEFNLTPKTSTSSDTATTK